MTAFSIIPASKLPSFLGYQEDAALFKAVHQANEAAIGGLQMNVVKNPDKTYQVLNDFQLKMLGSEQKLDVVYTTENGWQHPDSRAIA